MGKKPSIFCGLLVLVLSVSAGCSRPATAPAFDRGEVPAPSIQPGIPTAPSFPGDNANKGGAGEVTAISDQRMIVRAADVSLIVKSVTDVRDQIAGLAENSSGFVVSSSVSGEGQDMRGRISVRVPDEQFQPTLVELRKLAIRVESESTNSQDVTEQYTDLQARLKNAQATENQYVALLSQAKTVDDTLRIYQALSQVRQQIEQLQGQIQYLERTTSMSLINVSLKPQGTSAELVTPGWSPLEVLKSATRAIISFGKVLVNLLIWVAIFSPVWGTVLIIRWFLVRRAKKRGK